MSEKSGTQISPSYHRLTVKAVREETAEAQSFVLVPERAEADLFTYEPGQFLTFRIPYEGGDISRSYSLSTAPSTEPDMMICVKRVEGGRGSNWFIDNLKTGARIEATMPAGKFTLRNSQAPLLFIAGGSGITPCISLVKHALTTTGRQVKLLYANQSEKSVIYRETLDMLEKRFTGRFTCQHWLDDGHGFLTQPDIAAAVTDLTTPDSYICGPEPLMDLAEQTLIDQFGQEAKILTERFVSPDDTLPAQGATQTNTLPVDGMAKSFRLTLDGMEQNVPILPGQTLLEAALSAGIDAPSSCHEGHCGTCMAWLRSGDVTMPSTKGLSKRNIEKGYVLACQAQPTSAEPIWLDFDL